MPVEGDIRTGYAASVFAPAPLPRRAWILGSVAVLVWLAVLTAFILDLRAGRSAFASGSAVAGIGACLAWVLADLPLAYEVHPHKLIVRTLLRRVEVRVPTARRCTMGRDRFAINGGFGWYGWFLVDGKSRRAWVTDPAKAVEAGGILISPAEPNRLVAAIRGHAHQSSPSNFPP